ncbi:hypothetical protein T492DRAFT_375245 [Pavlovales sp. CCMP2436]|nr:hypothetical protein T492DRAFT_375245 [Pavlovales sp. CCMP2436]
MGDPAADATRRHANTASFVPKMVLLSTVAADPAAEPGSLAELVPHDWQRRWAVEEAASRWQAGFRADQPQFRSTVLYCEVKFNQALEICRELGPGLPSGLLTLAACECLQVCRARLAGFRGDAQGGFGWVQRGRVWWAHPVQGIPPSTVHCPAHVCCLLLVSTACCPPSVALPAILLPTLLS